MIETPAQHPGYLQSEPLRRFSFHTGAQLRPLHPDEPCPPLLRDLGPGASRAFLEGRLERLAGPLSPITYLRTAAWSEPYTDHGRIGRLVALRPLELGVWHAGVPHIYVARASRMAPPEALAFAPGHLTLAEAQALAADVPDRAAWREALGGGLYDAMLEDSRERLLALDAELEAAEALGQPLRAALKVPDVAVREPARQLIEAIGLTEHDLCAAWHHLPAARRLLIREALEAHRASIARLTEAAPPHWRARYTLSVR